MSLVKMTRRVAFSSGHRYWIGSLSEDENRKLFGWWASKFNHGHNYILDVVTQGEVNPSHGMVVNIKDIDQILQREIVNRFDQKSLNDETGLFDTRPPSVENILLVAKELIEDKLPSEVDLVELKLEETPLLYGEWTTTPTGERMTLTRIYEFSASHRLQVDGLSPEQNVDLFGKCNNPAGHGHNYLVEVTVSGTPDPITGMMVDIEALDRVAHAEVIDRYDHKHLNNDIPEFAGKNPTTEIVTQAVFDRLKSTVPGKLERVRVHETARNIFEVSANE